MDKVIAVGTRTYHEKSHGEFEIPFGELADLRFNDVPPYSTLEIRPLPVTSSFFHATISATHAGGPGIAGEYSLSVKIFFVVAGSPDNPTATAKCARIRKYIHRAFQSIAQDLGFRSGPDWMPFFFANGELNCVEIFYRDYAWHENPVLAREIEPFLMQYDEVAQFRDTLLFICHASEDKPFVESLCSFLDSSQVAVWYDKREIKVGDSIVQRIGDGLVAASHMVIVLSKASVKKPWVRKELSAALMRQLRESSIGVLPVLVEDCEIPPLLADLRYADCRGDLAKGFRELVAVVG